MERGAPGTCGSSSSSGQRTRPRVLWRPRGDGRRPSRQVLEAQPRAAVYVGEGGEEWEGLHPARSKVWSQTLAPLPEGGVGRQGASPLPLKATAFNQHLDRAPSVCPEVLQELGKPWRVQC